MNQPAAPEPSATPESPANPGTRHAYFETLRKEILDVKARLVWLIVIGLVGVPVITYFALKQNDEINLLLIMAPLLVLLLIVVYFSEQMSMMRAGTYIHDKLEAGDHEWEHWVNELRSKAAEPQLFGLLVIVGLAYSLLMACFAVETMLDVDPAAHSYFIYYVLRYAVPMIYVLSFLWVFTTLFHFWNRAFRTHWE